MTGSALLDLTSARWLDRLVDYCREVPAILYFALSYDGHTTWAPPLDLDRTIVELVNQHQRGDKGFGPALGPVAWRRLASKLESYGYQVFTAESPWLLGNADQEIQSELVRSWTAVASEVWTDKSTTIGAWCADRLSLDRSRAFRADGRAYRHARPSAKQSTWPGLGLVVTFHDRSSGFCPSQPKG